MNLLLLPILITIFLFGIVIGSFLNVCIYRLPKNESIVVVPSHCMSCGERLKWYELIPLFSYIFQKGKCRHCGVKLSIQYPVIEGLNGLLYIWIFVVFRYELIPAILGCLLASTLLVLSIIDERTQEIDNGVLITVFVLGLIHMCVNISCWQTYVIGLFVVSGIIFIIRLATKGRGMGDGDMYLMAGAGLFLGWKNVLLAFVLGCILGAIIHPLRMKFGGKDKVLAFGPYLSIGIFIAMLYGERIINWYINLLAL